MEGRRHMVLGSYFKMVQKTHMNAQTLTHMNPPTPPHTKQSWLLSYSLTFKLSYVT